MIKVALLQSRDHGSYKENLARTIDQLRIVAAEGAQLVCTTELFLSNYFCCSQSDEAFSLAESIPGKSTGRLQEIAKELSIVIVASLFEKEMEGLFYNTAVCINSDGTYLGKYRKSHIPQDPHFEEKFYFAPGDTGFQVFSTSLGKIGLMICWDQWFPESARLLALQGAELIVAPTAIGWLADEKENDGAGQLRSWENVQKGQAVANSTYVLVPNRVGVEGAIEFWGKSFVANYYGEIIGQASVEDEETLYADCDLESLRKHRRIWPFFRDRRIDLYGDLEKRSF